MQIVFSFFVRLVLVAAGLVFAASLAVLASVLLVLWGVRAVWCKLTGQPVNPFAMRMSPSAGFGNIYRSRNAPGAADSPAKSKRMPASDVTDVQAKDLDNRPH